MISLNTNKIAELIADADDSQHLEKSYSARQVLKRLLVESTIALTKEQRISINKALGNYTTS